MASTMFETCIVDSPLRNAVTMLCCSAVVLTAVFTNMENIEEGSEQSELLLNDYENFVSFVKVNFPW